MATIHEALQNANANLDNLKSLGMALFPLVKAQLNNAVTLLNKGYDLDDDIETLLDKYKNINDVPEKLQS